MCLCVGACVESTLPPVIHTVSPASVPWTGDRYVTIMGGTCCFSVCLSKCRSGSTDGSLDRKLYGGRARVGRGCGERQRHSCELDHACLLWHSTAQATPTTVMNPDSNNDRNRGLFFAQLAALIRAGSGLVVMYSCPTAPSSGWTAPATIPGLVLNSVNRGFCCCCYCYCCYCSIGCT